MTEERFFKKYMEPQIKRKQMEEIWKPWAKNLLKFTAPSVAVFFAQLALGVEPRIAGLTALLGLYGALSDLFKKLSS